MAHPPDAAPDSSPDDSANTRTALRTEPDLADLSLIRETLDLTRANPDVGVARPESGAVGAGWDVQQSPRTLPDDHPLLTPTETINTPERLEFRRQLVADVLGDARTPETGPPVLYLMGGGGASGKGTLLDLLIDTGQVPSDNRVYLDPDGLKERIPEYGQIVAAGDSRAAATVHEESSALAKDVLSKAMARQVDIVYDVTLGNPRKALDLIQRAKAEGYEVRLYGVTVDAATAVQRSMSRAATTGRYVPVDMLLTAHRGFSYGFAAYADLADRVSLFDNNGPVPAPIAIKRAGRDMVILDPNSYDVFQRKSTLDVTARTPADLHRAPIREAPPQTTPHRTAYISDALDNLTRTSRTAAGTIDTSASVEKAGQMAADLTGDRAATLAQANYRRVIEHLHDQRNATFSSAAELRGFVEDVVRKINSGITQEGVLYRQHDSTKYPSYTSVADLDAAADGFFAEFFDRLADPDADPIEVAAWVEYRMDLTDHLWADGCGKSAKATAAWVLMRHGYGLPVYPAERAEQFAHAPRRPRAMGPGIDAMQYREWLDYYVTLFGRGHG